jgi:hypothetical protein
MARSFWLVNGTASSDLTGRSISVPRACFVSRIEENPLSGHQHAARSLMSWTAKKICRTLLATSSRLGSYSGRGTQSWARTSLRPPARPSGGNPACPLFHEDEAPVGESRGRGRIVPCSHWRLPSLPPFARPTASPSTVLFGRPAPPGAPDGRRAPRRHRLHRRSPTAPPRPPSAAARGRTQ